MDQRISQPNSPRANNSRTPKSASSASLRPHPTAQRRESRTRRTSGDLSEYALPLSRRVEVVVLTCRRVDSSGYYLATGPGIERDMPGSRRTSTADGVIERTPIKGGSSPSMRRGITLPPSEGTSSGSRIGYGSTATSSNIAGLGIATGGGGRVDVALSSPRRISTSQAPPSAFRRSQSPAPLVPTHEAYYSQTQPPTATTPRFRDRDIIAQSQGNTPRLDTLHLPARHRRNFSQASGFLAPGTGPSSPVGSVFKTLRHRASNIGLSIGKPDTYDEDIRKDSDTEDEEPAQTANGTRVWYSSYVTIDWIHDAVRPTICISLTVDQRIVPSPTTTTCC
jgi:hypothetical protein